MQGYLFLKYHWFILIVFWLAMLQNTEQIMLLKFTKLCRKCGCNIRQFILFTGKILKQKLTVLHYTTSKTEALNKTWNSIRTVPVYCVSEKCCTKSIYRTQTGWSLSLSSSFSIPPAFHTLLYQNVSSCMFLKFAHIA